MYTWELEEFIKERNYYLGGDDLIRVISTDDSPQIIRVQHVTTDDGQEIYRLTTEDCFSDGKHEIEFRPMNYQEAEAKGLVKRTGPPIS